MTARTNRSNRLRSVCLMRGICLFAALACASSWHPSAWGQTLHLVTSPPEQEQTPAEVIPLPLSEAPCDHARANGDEDVECEECTAKLSEEAILETLRALLVASPSTEKPKQRYVYSGQMGTFHLAGRVGTAHIHQGRNTLLLALTFADSKDDYLYYRCEQFGKSDVWRFARNDSDGFYEVSYGEPASIGTDYNWFGSICHCRITVKGP